MIGHPINKGKDQTLSYFGEKGVPIATDTYAEQYIGNIFSLQKTGFKTKQKFNLEERKSLDSSSNTNNTQYRENILKENEKDIPSGYYIEGLIEGNYDPAIKYGRDGLLFLRPEFTQAFVKQTDFTIEEIKNLKNIYLNFSQSGKGIDFEHFEYLLQYLYNIQNHPFKVELFKYFDGTGDNCIEFREFIYGLCKLQRGNFNEKGEICFKVYDIYQQGELDIECLRHLLKKNYISRMIQIESCIQKTKELSTENEEGLSWEEFSLNLLPDIANCLSIPLDRKEYEKSLINELEFEHCFGIEEVESLWNLFRLALDQELTPTRVKWAEAFQAHSPHLLNEQQFKYVMSSKLKVKDLHLLTKLFEMADTDKNNALDIREIVSAILFHLRGTLQHKFALFFDIFAYTSLPLKNILPKEIIIQLLLNSLYLLKLELKSAKRTADQMNTKLDGCISYEEFMNYCENIPNAFDFLGRITLGPYPIPEEREEIFATYSQGEKSLSNFRKTKYPKEKKAGSKLVEEEKDNLETYRLRQNGFSNNAINLNKVRIPSSLMKEV